MSCVVVIHTSTVCRYWHVYCSHQNSPGVWSKCNVLNDHALGFPVVDLGSNWGQTGVIRGFFTMRRALNNWFCAVSFGDYGIVQVDISTGTGLCTKAVQA